MEGVTNSEDRLLLAGQRSIFSLYVPRCTHNHRHQQQHHHISLKAAAAAAAAFAAFTRNLFLRITHRHRMTLFV